MNKFRAGLESGKVMFGSNVNLVDYRICEMLGMAGFDYLWIDMEHAVNDFQTMEMDLIAAKSTGTASLVRASWNDIPFIKRVLECGADAIVVPMVNSVEECQKFIDNCIYPPEGKRGWGPYRAINYGLTPIKEYSEKINKEVCRFVQIETAEAVEYMDEMSKIPYLDGFVIGPMDLSSSVGELSLNLKDKKKTLELIDMIVKKARDAGKYLGIATGADNIEELQTWANLGVDFITAGLDTAFIMKGAKNTLDTLNLAMKNREVKKEYQKSF